MYTYIYLFILYTHTPSDLTKDSYPARIDIKHQEINKGKAYNSRSECPNERIEQNPRMSVSKRLKTLGDNRGSWSC